MNGAWMAIGLLATMVAVAAPASQTGPPVHIAPGEGHAEAVAGGWVEAEFADDGIRLEVRSAPGTLTRYGAVLSLVNHGPGAATFCLSGSPQGPSPAWTLHGDRLHWESGQPYASLVTLEAGEERQVEVTLDWRDAGALGGTMRWTIIPFGAPGCSWDV